MPLKGTPALLEPVRSRSLGKRLWSTNSPQRRVPTMAGGLEAEEAHPPGRRRPFWKSCCKSRMDSSGSKRRGESIPHPGRPKPFAARARFSHLFEPSSALSPVQAASRIATPSMAPSRPRHPPAGRSKSRQWTPSGLGALTRPSTGPPPNNRLCGRVWVARPYAAGRSCSGACVLTDCRLLG